jgi:hypothetical protein
MSVTALGLEIASEDSSHRVVPMAPNMCITPAAPSPLPMPYPVLGDTGSLDPGCNDVQISGKKSMTTRCAATGMRGNEAGTQKDIVSMVTGGKAFALVGAPTVLFEGAMVVVTGSPGFTNTR